MKVSYKGKFPTGSFLNEDIGFEIEIPTNTDEEALKAVSHLRDLAEKAHRERYPDPIDPNEEIKVVQKEEKTNVDYIIEDIEKCTTLDEKNSFGVQLGLLAYESLALHPRIKEAYDKKLQSLQNKQ